MMDRHTTCALTRGYASLADSGSLLNILRRAGRTMRRAKTIAMTTDILATVHFSNEVDAMTAQRMAQQMGDRAYHMTIDALSVNKLDYASVDGSMHQLHIEVDDPEMGGRIEGVMTETTIFVRRWAARNGVDIVDDGISVVDVYSRPDCEEVDDCDHIDTEHEVIDAPPMWEQDEATLCKKCGDLL
jgi:hypothetical protein